VNRRIWRGIVVCVLFALTALLPAARAAAAPLLPTALPAVPGSEVEPNNSPGTASPIQSGDRIRANLLAAGDIDYYRFEAQAGERVFAATVTAGSANASADSQLTLLASDGTTVLEFDDNDGSQAPSASSIAGRTIPANGTYYLKVNDASNSSATEIPYDLYLQLRSGTPPAEVEPNDKPGQANLLSTGEVTGTHTPGNPDLYSMVLHAGDTVFLSLDLDPERDGVSFTGQLGLGNFGDPGNERVLGVPFENEAPDLSSFPSDALVMTVATSGVYYVNVDAVNKMVGGAEATYDLSATVIPASQPSCRGYASSVSGPLTDGGVVEFPIEVGDVTRISRAAVRLSLSDTLMADLDVSLRTPAGAELPLFTDIGSTGTGGQERLEGVFDDYAAVPFFAYVSLRPLDLQPDNTARLSWLEGEQTLGTWNLVVRDDQENGTTGSLNSAELILCPEAEDDESKPIYDASFESGEEGFTTFGVNDQWEWGTPNTLGTITESPTPPIAGLSSCADGASCFKTNLDGPYAGTSAQELISPPISLAGRGEGPLIASWQQWYQLDSVRSDNASVTIEEANGGNPNPLWEWAGPAMTALLGNPASNNDYPVAAGWGRHRADISAYAGKTIRLHFHLASDGNGVSLAGLAIDDVRIYELPPPPPPGGSDGVAANLRQAGSGSAVSVTPPVLSGFSIAPRKFRAAKAGATVLAKRPPRGGALVSYQDSQAAETNIVLSKAQAGRKVRGKCARQTKANAAKKPCTRYVKVTSLVRKDVAGRNQFGLTGRANGRPLPAGEYQLQAKAFAPGGLTSAPVGVNFTILAPVPSSK
jgi:subtilisin-like proprotein convertase family protein